MKETVHDEYRSQGEQHWWFRARRDIFDRLLNGVVDTLPQPARILDIGPGSGVNLPILVPRGDVTVLDLSVSSLTECRARGARHVVYGDGTRPPLAPGGFDLVSALDVLEHLEDDTTALRAWHDQLRPGGTLLLSVPALGALWGRQDVLSGHHRRYRRGPLRASLQDAGFRVVRLTYFNTILFAPILGVRLAMRPFLKQSVARGGSDLAMPSFGLNGALYRLFSAEGRWVARRDLPIGVSLLAVAQKG